MAGINDYSNTPSLNTTINTIDVDEGCNPANINDAIRQLMADIADVDDGVVPLQTPDINGGTIDGASLGVSSPITSAVISGDLTVDTSTLKVDSTNNRVGIGTSSPSYDLQISKDGGGSSVRLDVVNTGVATNDDTLLSFVSGSNNNENIIFFGDTDDTNVGIIRYNHATDSMEFTTNASEAMRIDSSGNVGINQASPSAKLEIVATSATSGQDLIKLSNGADAAELVIDTSANEINFKTGTGDDIVFLPTGTEVARFTSAGLAIGGTGSANTLDDYEEGTFTPTLTQGTATTQLGSYVKVGNVCHIFINIADFSDTTTAANIIMTLPFTCKSGDAYQSTGSVMYRYADILNGSGLSAYLNDNTASLNIYQNNTTGNWSPLRYDELNNALNAFRIQLTYFTA